MVNLSNFLLELTKPSGLWSIILEWIESWTANFGWTIIVFTILIKIVLLPLDFYNRYSTKKNTLIQKRLSPQVSKINQKYKNNNALANQQISALYKREGYNMIGSCLFMLINMVLTLVIFFSIFSSLRNMSSYKMLTQYVSLEETYYSVYDGTESSIVPAQAQTLEKFEEIKSDSEFLWIKSIWRNDTSNSIIPTYDQLGKAVKTAKDKNYTEYFNNIDSVKYTAVTSSLSAKYNMWNGFYILAVLSAITSFLAQYVTELSNKTKVEREAKINNPTQKSMKYMKILLPIIMVVFVLTNTASFGIYIVISSIMGIFTTLICNYFVKTFTKKEEEKYNKFIEKFTVSEQKNIKPTMTTYKKLGDRL